MDALNATVLTAFSLAIVGLLIWFVGSLALRFLGWMWLFFGLAIAINGASTGEATLGTYALALFNVAVGAVFWAAGHTLYRIRHGHWKSAALRRVVDRSTALPRGLVRSRWRQHDCDTP